MRPTLASTRALPSLNAETSGANAFHPSWRLNANGERRNRRVRRMTAAIGHPTLRLIRVKIGKLELGDMRIGQWRELDKDMRHLIFE
jgi:pseudouridine synthase